MNATRQTGTLNESDQPDGQAAGPRKRIIVIADYCTHAAGSDCRRCTQCCPHGAISLPEGGKPAIDDSACTGCGICYGVCDAFSPTRITINDLHARIRRIASTGERVYFTCRENVFPGLEVDTKVIVLPCLAMVSPELWTLMLAEGIRTTVACDLAYCEDCDRAGPLGGQLFPQCIRIAEQRTGGTVLHSPRIPEKSSLVDKYARNPEGMGRRAAFGSLASDVGQIASGKRRLRNSEVLQDFYEKRERQRAVAQLNLADATVFNDFVPQGRIRQVAFPKQRMLVEAVSRKPDMAENIDIALSVTDQSLCTQSYVCVKRCPTGARQPGEDGAVSVKAPLCVGCGICVDTCQAGACRIEQATAQAYLDQ